MVKIRGSENWYVQWFEAGHSRRLSTRTRSRPEAEAFLRAVELESERQPTGAFTVSDALDLYWSDKREQIQSLETTRLAIDRLKAHFGATLAMDCGPSLQRTYVATRRLPVEKPIGKTGKTRTVRVKDTTIQRDLNVLGAALKHAAFFERIPASPPVMSLAKEEPRERFLTRKEAAAIFRRFRREKLPHLLLFSRLALYTGARTGAILDLTWDRVDLARGRVSYPKPGRKPSKKKRVVVFIEPHLVRALTAAKRRAQSDHVIEWRGKPVARIVRGFRRHMLDMGLHDVSPHIFRHTFATWAAGAGEPLHAIGGVLGQSVTHTTERYAKQQPEAQRKVVRAVRRK